jgi:hypothetical protein
LDNTFKTIFLALLIAVCRLQRLAVGIDIWSDNMTV